MVRKRASFVLTRNLVDSSASNSFSVVGPGDFDISYVDGSGSKGDYFTDAFEIAGASLTNLTMGLGRTTDIPFGLVGVGYASNEAIVSNSQSLSSAYPNLPVAMVQEGLIKTNAYSLWLNDLGGSRRFSLVKDAGLILGPSPLTRGWCCL